MSALQRLRFFSFCSAFGTVVLYTTLPSGISIITYTDSQLGVVEPLKALWVVGQPLI